MSLTLEHKFLREVEPESLSLFKHEEYCIPLEIHVEVEYDGDELLEDSKSIQVFHNDQDITAELSRRDFDYIQLVVSQEVGESAYDILAKLEEPYEYLIQRAD